MNLVTNVFNTLPAHIQLVLYMWKVLLGNYTNYILLFSVDILAKNKSYYPYFIFYYCISHPEGATNYTFLQAVERMKKIRKSIFPPTPKNLNHLNNLLLLENNRHFTMTFQTPESLYVF